MHDLGNFVLRSQRFTFGCDVPRIPFGFGAVSTYARPAAPAFLLLRFREFAFWQCLLALGTGDVSIRGRTDVRHVSFFQNCLCVGLVKGECCILPVPIH